VRAFRQSGPIYRISFIAVVIFMPYGLAGLLNQIKGKIYAQKAQKSVKRYSSATLIFLKNQGVMNMSDSILEIRNLTVSFDGFKAVDGLSTSVKKGDIHFFIGPNGAGKTTLLDAICGRVKPAEGKIIFKGMKDVTKCRNMRLWNWE